MCCSLTELPHVTMSLAATEAAKTDAITAHADDLVDLKAQCETAAATNAALEQSSHERDSQLLHSRETVLALQKQLSEMAIINMCFNSGIP